MAYVVARLVFFFIKYFFFLYTSEVCQPSNLHFDSHSTYLVGVALLIAMRTGTFWFWIRWKYFLFWLMEISWKWNSRTVIARHYSMIERLSLECKLTPRWLKRLKYYQVSRWLHPVRSSHVIRPMEKTTKSRFIKSLFLFIA